MSSGACMLLLISFEKSFCVNTEKASGIQNQTTDRSTWFCGTMKLMTFLFLLTSAYGFAGSEYSLANEGTTCAASGICETTLIIFGFASLIRIFMLSCAFYWAIQGRKLHTAIACQPAIAT